jgi:glycosyltransferase involved in cell wall biosynthesis
MTNNSTVSVVIIFLNAAEFLQEAVESVLVQTFQHWELLLVDDGSSDGSSEIARSLASQDLSRIHYLEHEGHQNRGMSASRNLGIHNAKGDYIAFLDADDYWLPDRLVTHVRVLDSYPGVGMLYGTAKYWYSWTGLPEDRQRDFVPELRVQKNTLFDPPQLLSLLLEGKAEVPCTCSILVRREITQKIGGFEESFRGMYEDQAFYAKICLSVPVLATGDCLAWYRQHSKSNYSNAINSGQLNALHFHFLKWLKAYCNDREVINASVLQVIHRQLWLYGNPSHRKFPGLFQNNIRRIRKWILRVEERILPSQIRSWLWTHK